MRVFLPSAFLALLLVGCVARPGPVNSVSIEQYAPPAESVVSLESLLADGESAGRPVEIADVRIIPILNPAAPAECDYLTVHEALRDGLCEISEQHEVNQLRITNNSDKAIFLMVGDLVLGGSQDRIAAESLVVEPGTKDQDLPVFCVEHGRWSPEDNAASKSDKFYAREEAEQVDVRVKGAAIRTGNQSEVWNAVSANNSLLSVTKNSTTGAFRATFDDPETRKRIDELYDKAKQARESNAVGYAVVQSGSVVALDVFDSRGLCGKLSEKLLRSYVITALSGGYDPAPRDGSADRYKDRATIRFHKIDLEAALKALDEQWRGELRFERYGDAEVPMLDMEMNDATMESVLDTLQETTDCRVRYVGQQVVVELGEEPHQEQQVEARPIFGSSTQGLTLNSSEGINFTITTATTGEFITASEPPPAVPGESAPNDATETHRNDADGGVKYTCTDKKRGSTVHRSFVRR